MHKHCPIILPRKCPAEKNARKLPEGIAQQMLHISKCTKIVRRRCTGKARRPKMHKKFWKMSKNYRHIAWVAIFTTHQFSFRICNFGAIGVTLKNLWGLAVGKNDRRDIFVKRSNENRQAIGFKVLTHLNPNKDFQSMQFEALHENFYGVWNLAKMTKFSQN